MKLHGSVLYIIVSAIFYSSEANSGGFIVRLSNSRSYGKFSVFSPRCFFGLDNMLGFFNQAEDQNFAPDFRIFIETC